MRPRLRASSSRGTPADCPRRFRLRPRRRSPVALRYAAVATAGNRVVIAAGRSVFAFDPARRTLRRIARLPHPLTHSSAATLNGIVYLLGGRGVIQGTQTRRVLAIDPRTGSV